MKFKVSLRFWMGAIVAGAIAGVSSIASAAESYDLYSWKKPDAHYSCYVLVPSSDQPPDAAALKASKDVACNKNMIKHKLESLPQGAVVSWKVAPDQGLTLPSPEAVKSIQQFSAQNDHPITMKK